MKNPERYTKGQRFVGSLIVAAGMPFSVPLFILSIIFAGLYGACDFLYSHIGRVFLTVRWHWFVRCDRVNRDRKAASPSVVINGSGGDDA